MNEKQRRSKWLIIIEPLVILFVFVAAFELGKRVDSINNEKYATNAILKFFRQSTDSSQDKLQEVLNAIRVHYVDSVNLDTLEEKAISLLLKDLDPHSTYFPPVISKQENDEMKGSFEGIGIYFNVQHDTVVVVGIIPGGPSEKSGLMPGDKIISVDDTSIVGMNTYNIMKRIKGPKGSKVKITVIKPFSKDTISYIIKRDVIPIKSVDVYFKVKKDIGYIKISRFAETTYDEFVKAVNYLHSQGVKKIILDLRGNPGGYMQIAVKIADEFLPEGKTIVYIKGRTVPKKVFVATDHDLCVNDSVAILIDEWSASASEILSGAIQDNDRGVIIGRRSFGKGLVQEPIFFRDGSQVRLTIARYYTPVGRCIQRDYEKGAEKYYDEIAKRYTDGEVFSPDSIHFPDSLKYKTPKGKIVYGGGGIMPDIFVPLDTTKYDDFYYDVASRNLFYKFAFYYSNNHRDKLSKFKDYKQLYKYLKNHSVWQEFLKFVKDKGVKSNPKTAYTTDMMKEYVYAFIVRIYFGDKGFYPIYLKYDKVFQKAVEYFLKRENKIHNIS